jgi:hypothetical protein
VLLDTTGFVVKDRYGPALNERGITVVDWPARAAALSSRRREAGDPESCCVVDLSDTRDPPVRHGEVLQEHLRGRAEDPLPLLLDHPI